MEDARRTLSTTEPGAAQQLGTAVHHPPRVRGRERCSQGRALLTGPALGAHHGATGSCVRTKRGSSTLLLRPPSDASKPGKVAALRPGFMLQEGI